MKFTDAELHLLANALRTAREIYLETAGSMRKESQERLAKQFDTQANGCNALMERLAAEGFC